MPPKRKRATAEEAPTTTRSTRSTAKASANVQNEEVAPAPSKKAKTGKTKAAPKTKGGATSEGAGSSKAKDLKSAKSKSVVVDDSPPPYTPQRALDLFDSFADPDVKDVIGPEGFAKMCEDGQIPLEGVQPLLLSWQLSASEMAKLTKDEWTKGMQTLQIASLPPLRIALSELEDLIVLGKDAIKRSPANGQANEPYNRVNYYKYTTDPKGAFLNFYQFCFALVKPEQSRNIDMETATALWSVILPSKYPIMNEIIEFIQEKGTYKAVNKDLWSMMHEFCETVSPTLENYEAEGAWPTLLDNFVEWKKAKEAMSE